MIKQTRSTAYLGLGANLGDVKLAIAECLKFLDSHHAITVKNCSSCYRNTAIGGPVGQPDFVNCVCQIETSLSAYDLMSACLEAEKHFGRVRTQRWGPRTLDVDIIIFGDLVLDEDGLTIPHPRFKERLFVLVPLCDVAPNHLKIPGDSRVLKDILTEQLTYHRQKLEDWVENVI